MVFPIVSAGLSDVYCRFGGRSFLERLRVYFYLKNSTEGTFDGILG
jgi:hypothetical protein